MPTRAIERERSAWLAEISPRHESRLRTFLRDETEATAERERLEWLASISPGHENQLRRLLKTEARAREARARGERLVEGWDV